MTKTYDNNGPFANVRIVDLTTVIYGPYATRVLADLGAEVIKIESNGGDIMRYPGSSVAPAMGPIHLSMNRNKQSVELDISGPAAKEALLKLIQSADVFVTNVRLRALQKLGIAYEDLKKIKPDIIYVHATGFDTKGPYGSLPAYEDLIQAATGMADLFRQVKEDDPPRFMPAIIADKVAGMHVVYAMMAALFHKERTGEGQHVEVPMMESLASFNLIENMFGNTFIPQNGPICYPRSVDLLRRPHKTKDGYLAIMPYSDADWVNILKMGGRTDLLEDPRLANFKSRTENISMLYETMTDFMPSRTTDEWFGLLREAGVPCMKITALSEIQNDVQLNATGFFERREHPTVGPYVSLRHPVRFEKTPATIYRDAPTLGQDTEAVLSGLGYSQEQIEVITAPSENASKSQTSYYVIDTTTKKDLEKAS